MARHFKWQKAKRRNAVGCGGDDGGYFDMDNRWILRQKKGGLIYWEWAGSYSAKPPGNVLRDHSGNDPQQQACSEQKCSDFAQSISLQELSRNITPLKDGQPPFAVITNGHSYFLPTTTVGYVQALNAPTFNGA